MNPEGLSHTPEGAETWRAPTNNPEASGEIEVGKNEMESEIKELEEKREKEVENLEERQEGEGKISKEERERLIEEEKQKIWQEKIDHLFEEFKDLAKTDLESILRTGRMENGSTYESKSMGALKPETAQGFAQAFEQGMRLATEILKNLPDIINEFDEELTKEAEERVDKRIAETEGKIEPEKMAETNKPETEKPEQTPLPAEQEAGIESGPESPSSGNI